MMAHHLRLAIVSCVAALASTSTAWTQTFLVDDFNRDGLNLGDAWESADAAEGTPWGPGIIEILDGKLHHGTTGVVPPADVFTVLGAGTQISAFNGLDAAQVSNGFIQAKVRSDVGSNVNLIMRGDLETLSGHLFYGQGGAGAFGISTFVNGELVEDIGVEGYTPGDDWMIKGGAVGSTLMLKAWKAEEPEPDDFLIVTERDQLTSGLLGVTSAVAINSNDQPLPLNSFYDDISFTVPEPSSAVLALLGAGALVVCCVRKAIGSFGRSSK